MLSSNSIATILVFAVVLTQTGGCKHGSRNRYLQAENQENQENQESQENQENGEPLNLKQLLGGGKALIFCVYMDMLPHFINKSILFDVLHMLYIFVLDTGEIKKLLGIEGEGNLVEHEIADEVETITTGKKILGNNTS